jgi:hypothetical protein
MKKATMDQPRLAVVWVAIGDIRPDPANPRKHDERNLAEITASLRDHGQVEPIVLQAKTNRLIAGHGRLEGMKRLEWTHAQAVHLDVSDLECVRLGIRLNRTGELAGWDDATLTSLLKMPELGEVGFNAVELDAFFKPDEAEDGEGEGSGSGGSRETFEVVVVCDSAKAQKALARRLTKEGLNAKASTTREK